MGPYCVWLVIVGGVVTYTSGTYVTEPNITMLIELGKYVFTKQCYDLLYYDKNMFW